MATGIDVVLNENPKDDEVLYDLQLSPEGDFVSSDQLDTAILVSMFTDARAAAYEIVRPALRRGWVGDLELDDEESHGSKLWLLEQERLTPVIVTKAADILKSCLAWMVTDRIASSVATRGFIEGQTAMLQLDIRKPNSRTETRFVSLWDNTGK